MARRFLSPLCCLSVCLSLGAAHAGFGASVAASPAPSTIAEGGQKLADDDVAGAIRSLQTVVKAQPDNVDALHLLTVAYLHAGRHALAADAAQLVLKREALDRQSRAVAALLLGRAQYGVFVEGFQKCSSNAGSLPDMAQLLTQMSAHHYETASGSVIVEQGDVNAPDDFRSLQSDVKGSVADLQKSLKQAEEAYKQALDSPRLAGVHDGLGLIHVAQGFPGEARREFETELSQFGPSGEVYAHLGALDAMEGHDEDAIADLRHAVALAPQLQTPYEELARLYGKAHDDERRRWAQGMAALVRGNLRAADAALAKSSPSTADLLCGQAHLALAQTRWDDARRLLTQAQARVPQDAHIAATLGDLEEAQGHHAQALTTYKQALALDPACDAAWYGSGLAYDGQNNPTSAMDDYRQALQTNPNNPLARLNLAADEVDGGQPAQAAADLREYLQRFPTAKNTYSVTTLLAQVEAK